MRKHHPQNERVKRQYLAYLEEAKRMDVSSVDQAAAAISLFEESTGHRDFRAFHIEQARRFKRQLNEHINPATKKPLAKSTIRSRLTAVKVFFVWLAGQPGYKSKLKYTDMDYFNVSANDSRIASAVRERPAPSIDQIRHVLQSMPSSSAIEKRNRALIAFTLLSGARDQAIASMCIKHVDLTQRTVFHDAREVRTKNAKTFTSCFFPLQGNFEERIVVEWITFLTVNQLFGPNDPLFAKTKMTLDLRGYFEPTGLERVHWSDASPIRRIFREAFEAAGLPYFHPHSFRKTLGELGEKTCMSAEQFKAWSQNLGHEHVSTTFTSYGAVRPERQREILTALADGAATDSQLAAMSAHAKKFERLFEKFGIE